MHVICSLAKTEAEMSHTLRHSKQPHIIREYYVATITNILREEDECAPLRTAKTAGIIKNGITRNSH